MKLLTHPDFRKGVEKVVAELFKFDEPLRVLNLPNLALNLVIGIGRRDVRQLLVLPTAEVLQSSAINWQKLMAHPEFIAGVGNAAGELCSDANVQRILLDDRLILGLSLGAAHLEYRDSFPIRTEEVTQEEE